tara:strand:+ start:100 stop:321 length:222 start_codon:yes stop_codon:yes gene_type:complete
MKKLVINIILVLIWIYQKTISRMFPPVCKFNPSCSNYALQAIQQYGIKGIVMGIMRVLKCHPLSKSHGWDPVK